MIYTSFVQSYNNDISHAGSIRYLFSRGFKTFTDLSITLYTQNIYNIIYNIYVAKISSVQIVL